MEVAIAGDILRRKADQVKSPQFGLDLGEDLLGRTLVEKRRAASVFGQVFEVVAIQAGLGDPQRSGEPDTRLFPLHANRIDGRLGLLRRLNGIFQALVATRINSIGKHQQGSVITFYLNGLGNRAPVATLESPQPGSVVAVEPDPDSPMGVWRMRVQLAASASSGAITPLIEGARLRYGSLAVWIAP